MKRGLQPDPTFTGTGRSTHARRNIRSKEMSKFEPKHYIPPSKFKAWSQKMYEILEDPDTVIFTDRQLIDYVNGHLPIEDTISYHTFEGWMGHGRKSVENQKSISDAEAREFRIKLKFVRAKQKMNLTKDMLDPENKTPYKQQWLMERKFEDMKQNPTLQLTQAPTIQIEAGNKEQAALLDSIFNGTEETIDVEHKEIKDGDSE